MKILHVAPSIEESYGGPTQSLAGYVAAASRMGAEVSVAAPRASGPDEEKLEESGASMQLFDSSGAGGTARSAALVRWVRANSRSFDVVHVHGLFNFISSLSARAAIAAGSAVVIRPFGTLSRYTFSHRRSALKRLWFKALEKPNLIGAAGIHFTTKTERDEAAWHRLALDSKAHVVPPPYLSARTGIPRKSGRSNVVLFVGRLHPIKNLEALIDSWPGVIASYEEARLIIAGSGAPGYENALRDRARSLGVGSSISFPGFLSPAARDEALAGAALFVLPSFHENFGMAALEALGAGVPVVASTHVQLGDFVTANDLGAVTAASPSLLAGAIVATLSNTELRNRVAINGGRIVNDTYSIASVGKKLETMYLAVLETHRKRQTRPIG